MAISSVLLLFSRRLASSMCWHRHHPVSTLRFLWPSGTSGNAVRSPGRSHVGRYRVDDIADGESIRCGLGTFWDNLVIALDNGRQVAQRERACSDRIPGYQGMDCKKILYRTEVRAWRSWRDSRQKLRHIHSIQLSVAGHPTPDNGESLIPRNSILYAYNQEVGSWNGLIREG